jgi:hypothetical protein
MTLAVFQATVTDAQGNIQGGALVSVRDADTNILVTLKPNRDGSGSLGNPFETDGQGFARCYAPEGRYNIAATVGGIVTREWRDVPLAVGGSQIPATEEGDFLLNTGDGLEAVNFEDMVTALGTFPLLRGACFSGYNRAVGVPVNDVSIPVIFDATIKRVFVITQGGIGSCVLDIWKQSYASYPPDSGDSITAAAKPRITAGIKSLDSTLTGWTTAVSNGDVLTFHLESSSVFTAVAIFVELAPLGGIPADGMDDARVQELIAEALAEGGVIIDGDEYTVQSSGASGPVNLWTLVGQPTGPVTVNYTTPPGGIVSSTPGTPALDLRGFADDSVLNVVLAGPVLGCAGDGGDGASVGNTFGEDGGSGRRGISGHGARSGRDGGPAIVGPGPDVEFNLSALGGYAFGGGGGGGGGGASVNFSGDTNAAAGGGGGAGAGGARGGREGVAVAASTSAAATATALPGEDSTGGLSGAQGQGGTGAENGTASGGDGGDGGDWGADGSAGESPTGQDRDYTGGAAGAGGKAIELNGGSVTISDGDDSTHIKGDVS